MLCYSRMLQAGGVPDCEEQPNGLLPFTAVTETRLTGKPGSCVHIICDPQDFAAQ